MSLTPMNALASTPHQASNRPAGWQARCALVLPAAYLLVLPARGHVVAGLRELLAWASRR